MIFSNLIFSPDFIFLGLISICNFILGFVVFLRDTKSTTHRLFLYLTQTMVAWGIVNYFSYNVQDDFVGTILVRLVLFLAVLFAVFFFLLVVNFPNSTPVISRGKTLLIFGWSIVAMILCLSPFVIKEVVYVSGSTAMQVGWGMAIFALTVLFFDLGGLFSLIKKSFTIRNKSERSKHRFLLVGFLITLCLILTFSFVLPSFLNITYFVSFGPIFITPFIVFTVYTIARHRLFNVKIIVTEVVAFLLVIIAFGELLLSGSSQELIFRLLILIALSIFSVLLIRSVLREVNQREELQKLSEELQAANDRLKELDKQKTDFLSIASHQLRTPLSRAKGYLELLQEGAYGQPPAEMKEIFNNMDVSNEQLIHMIDEFLNVSRMEQGRTKYDFTKENLNELVAGVAAEIKEVAKAKGLKLVWHPNPALAKRAVLMDKEKIRNSVFGFVDNAIKYSAQGSVRVELAMEGDGAALSVKDEGAGFGAEDQKKFFQIYYRGDNVKDINVSGTGIGLYMCRRFIEEHGGRVWAKSAGLGKGSEFGFWIPLDGHVRGAVETAK